MITVFCGILKQQHDMNPYRVRTNPDCSIPVGRYNELDVAVLLQRSTENIKNLSTGRQTPNPDKVV
jgi:hypothetical protein